MALGAFAPFPLRLGGSAEEGLTAAQQSRLAADLAAAVRTMPFAVLLAIVNPSPQISVYRGQNGSGLSYAPTITLDGSSFITLTFASSFTDPYGIVRSVSLSRAMVAPLEITSTAQMGQEVSVSNNVVKVRIGTSVGVAGTQRATIAVW